MAKSCPEPKGGGKGGSSGGGKSGKTPATDQQATTQRPQSKGSLSGREH